MSLSYTVLRYSEKIADLNLSPLFGAPVGVTLSEFRRDLWYQKTRAPGLLYGILCVILRLATLVRCRLATDRHTDRQTDGDTMTAYTALA